MASQSCYLTATCCHIGELFIMFLLSHWHENKYKWPLKAAVPSFSHIKMTTKLDIIFLFICNNLPPNMLALKVLYVKLEAPNMNGLRIRVLCHNRNGNLIILLTHHLNHFFPGVDWYVMFVVWTMYHISAHLRGNTYPPLMIYPPPPPARGAGTSIHECGRELTQD